MHASRSSKNRTGAPALVWFVLLAAGQGASLALIEAGNRVSYQHYALQLNSPARWLGAATLVTQAVVVGLALRHRWGAIGAWVRRWLPPWVRVALIGAVMACSATASKEVGFYILELIVASAIQLVAIGNVVVLGASLNGEATASRVRRWFGPGGAGDRSRAIDGFAAGAAVWVVVAGTALAWWSYQRHPHVPDEVVYLLQARYLADGRLTMPLPPAPLALNIDLMYYDAARWFSPVPPGWPFVLAIGAWLGVPWLVNPVLGAANLLLAHAVLASMYERRVARLATVMLAVSPWFVFMSMNFMTHQLTLFFALLGALAVVRIRADRAREEGRLRPGTLGLAFAGGAAIGGASLVRPLEGLATALLLGVWSLPPRWWTLLATVRLTSFVPSTMLALGAVAGGALVRPYNRLMTGDPSYFPIMAYIDKYYVKGSNDLGFGANRGLGWSGLDPFPGHGPVDVVVNANLNVTAINVELLGWATGSLLAVFLLLALRRLSRPDWWHVAVILTIAGIHSFYWFSGGPDFGARYWYLIIVSCAALAARGVVEVGRSFTDPANGGGSRDAGESRAIALSLALTLAALLTFFPWRAVDKYYHYRGMRPDIRELASDGRFGRGLVFIRGKRHPDYASATIYNPIDLRAPVPLYAWDVSPEARAEALRAYPDRPVFFVDGPTVTGGAFHIAAGPLTSAEALRYGMP